MNRRDFLRYVGTGLVVGPAAVKALLAAPVEAFPVAPLAPWTGVQWWVKEFDFGNQLGVALGVTNPQTGERVRNAVRLMLPADQYRGYSDFMLRFIALNKHPYDGFPDIPSDAPEGVLAARRLHEMWAEEESYRQRLVPAPAWWRPSTTPGVRGDGILEGREMRA